MTPGARVAAAAEILDRIGAGAPAEQALTTWARGNRFAGSGDRAAIRDHVFDVLRRRESSAALGGGRSGRALMIGLLRGQGVDPATVFTGEGHAPLPLAAHEAACPDISDRPDPVRLDYPEWLDADLRASLGVEFVAVMRLMRDRAPVFLRVNLRRATRDQVVAALAGEGIAARPHPLADTALQVTENARRLTQSRAYVEGLFDLQDAASQAVAREIAASGPMTRVLDYCAGGGGKALALADAGAGTVLAHDAHPDRMKDLPVRAARAGVAIACVTAAEARARAPYDLVVTDVPCSGSGAWRRQPEARWTLTPDRLADLHRVQRQILDEAAPLVGPGGRLAYVTCSILRSENAVQVAGFLDANPGWMLQRGRQFLPTEGGDGFYLAILTRNT